MPSSSEEHHRASASRATPSPARTPGRFRDMFKPRRSASGGSPQTRTQPPPTVVEPEDVYQDHHKSLHTGAKNHSSIFEDAQHVPVTEPVVAHQLSPDVKLGTEMEVESVGAPLSSTPVQSKSPVTSPEAEHLQADITGEFSPVSDARSRQRSFASNIFDDQDSLSAGIREYVESKIAEAFHGHSCSCPVRAPLNITVKFELDSVGELSSSSSFKRIPTNTNVLHGSKRVGPFILEHSSNTYNIQKGIFIIYFCITTLAAFVGPKTLFLTTWRLALVLTVYFVIGRLLGWQKKAQPDLLLAPILYTVGAIYNIICDAIDQYGIFKVYLNSQIMRESLAEVGAVINPK